MFPYGVLRFRWRGHALVCPARNFVYRPLKRSLTHQMRSLHSSTKPEKENDIIPIDTDALMGEDHLPSIFNENLFMSQLPKHAYGAYYFYILNVRKYTAQGMHLHLSSRNLIALVKGILQYKFPHDLTRTRMEAIINNHKSCNQIIPLEVLLLLLKAVVGSRDRPLIQKVLGKIESLFAPNLIQTFIYTKIMQIFYKHGDALGIHQLYTTMQDRNIEPDSKCMTMLIQGMSEAGNIELCQKLLVDCKRLNIQVHSSAFQQYFKAHLLQRKYSEAIEQQKLIKDSVNHKTDYIIPWLNMVLRSRANTQERAQALDLVEVMTRNIKLHTNDLLYLSIIDSLCEDVVVDSGLVNENIKTQIETIARDMLDKKDHPNNDVLAALAVFFKKYNMGSSRVSTALLSHIISGGVIKKRLSIGAYSRLIGIYLQSHNLEAAYTLYYHLITHGGENENGVAPDEVIFHQFLVYFVKTSQHELGYKMYKKMLTDGASPNERVLKVACELTIRNIYLCRSFWCQLCDFFNQNVKHARRGVIRMGDLRIQPHMFRPIFVCYLQHNQFLMALGILRQMHDIKMTPTTSMYMSCALQASHLALPHYVSLICRHHLNVGHTPIAQSFNIEMTAWRSAGRLDRMEEILPLMKFHSVAPNQRTFECLILAYLENNKIDKAAKCFLEMKDAINTPGLVQYLMQKNVRTCPIKFHKLEEKSVEIIGDDKLDVFYNGLWIAPLVERPLRSFRNSRERYAGFGTLLNELARAHPVPPWVDRAECWDELRSEFE